MLGERADEREHLVGEAADVQDVAAVLRLCGGVGLDVQADEFGFGAALFQDVPFLHQAGFAAPLSAVCPAFVVGHDDDQIHIGFFAVQHGEWCAACRSAAADIGEFLGVGHDAVARVERHVYRDLFKRYHAGLRVGAQHGCRDERGDVDAAGFAGRAAAIAGGRAVHGAGDVRANHDFASDCRYVLYGGFHRILQGFADFKRHLFGCCLIRGQQLVRQDAGAADGGFVAQFFCHHFDVFAFRKHIMAQESVQVLANLLP